MKRIFSIFLVIVMLVLSLQTDIIYTNVKAATGSIDIWDGLTSAMGIGKFTKGAGTQENPYIIQNADQLYRMVYDFGTIEGKLDGTQAYYKLSCDIYLNDITNYDSWGKLGFDMSTLNNWTQYQDVFCHRTFYGNFDGEGHTIYGLYAYGYRTAAFFPNVGHGAVVKNINFKKSYTVNTSGEDANDQENDGETVGQKVWYAGTFGSAGVIFSNAMSAGDSDHNTVDFTINNCSVTDAYVEAKYFTSSFVSVANSCQPYISDCMTANVVLNSTSTTQGVVGAIINMPYGSTNPTANIENVLAVGYPIYGVGRDEMWSGKKQPSLAHTYTFKNVYSTVSNKFTFKHSSYGNLSYTDSEITVVDASKIIGAEAEKTLPGLDWAYVWNAVDGGYPYPRREYIVPSGKDYYLNGGPKYATDMWNGTVAFHFAAGDGSFEDPYLIANCEEFYRMVIMPENDKYYKIARGVTDLYFNDIEGKSYSSLMSSFSSSWFFSGMKYEYDENLCFNGSFDGNGVIIHGVRNSVKNYAGLFAQVGNATLRNFTVTYSYFKTSNSSAKGASAVIGNIKENSVVSIKNVAVIDCTVAGKTNAAGFIGNAETTSDIYIGNSIVSSVNVTSSSKPAYQSAFLANGTDVSITIQNSISLGIYPSSVAEVSYSAKHLGVYTDTSAPSTVVADATKNINIVEQNALIGETAKSTCKEFNWNYSWHTTDNIPLPRNQQNDNGIVGECWSGEIAISFAGGKGTKADPYQINTPEMLARMLIYGNAGEYYKLTADIKINDTAKTDWENSAFEWYTSSDVSAFEGSFDGNGYTVCGLYGNADTQNEYAALIPVLGTESKIRRVKIDNSYLVGVSKSYLGGIAGVLQDNAAVVSVIDACLVGNNVIFDGEANVGGIIANIGFSRAIVENCAFRGNITTSGNKYGICENVVGKLEVYECISKGAVPFDLIDSIVARNVYTDHSISKNGVIVIETDKMIGIAARNYMSGLNLNLYWRLSTTNTPEPTGNIKTYNGVKGEVWSGKIASSFAKGSGTSNNPYIIETGEQLALLITNAGSYANKYFKLGCDIYLNDVNGELWQSKFGAQNWINSHEAEYFRCNLDGDGYVVYGMHYNFKSTLKNSYMGLIPCFGGSSEVKNLGISQAYIKATLEDNSVYAGGIFGMGNAFYDFYGNKLGVDATEGDEFLIPGQTTPTKLPSITNCFVDHTCSFEATSVAGIGCPGGAAVVVRDCYVTASLKGKTESSEGIILGANWANCSRIYNCVAFPQTDNKIVSGNQQWIDSAASRCMHIENAYYYGSKHIFEAIRIKRPQWRIDEAAKENMTNLDWENVWRVEQNGTPVLRIFDKEGRGAELFSDKDYIIPQVTISFDTGVDGFEIEPLVGKIYEPIDLPIPKRQGYKFVAWHGYEDLTCVYDYDYFIARDITLYAEWQQVSVVQNFEKYPYTDWDCDKSVWRYNTPDNLVEYTADFVHDGEKSMQLMSSYGDAATLLVNYRNTLTAGQRYTLSLWVFSRAAQPQLAVAHKVYPDYLAEDKFIEPLNEKDITLGEWTQYTYTFTAQTPWIAIKILNGDGIYIDDIVVDLEGDMILQAETSNDVIEAEFYSSLLEKASITDGATNVGQFAFAYSDFITDIFIDDGVKLIDEYAFYGCKRLTDVWYGGSESDLEKLIVLDNNSPLLDAKWHFNSCQIKTEHQYDNDCDSNCNYCEYERIPNEHVYDDSDDIDCNVCGEIRIIAVMGDINNDGKINNKDLGILMQYLNGWEISVNDLSADINRDGKVNNKDYGLLMQYVNGWEI